ncbi:ankyrin repeat domain-containing protein [Microvirga sp. STS02]|uniref:ankyrin repeat domain-containing protein n=1 Tax=Hymenobacter negativus TaxID=2795026 RepID=UPI0018DBE246|nr:MULTISPECIES: ankyrin repeat domain-containing protein [Bacteria]MBH8569277.1 ankyrin repeat domain-containing protein [Hymenobacter negativus]MBR7209012.1 ankyrin repeat domain-containing protein [Microvirga sp. STS02]
MRRTLFLTVALFSFVFATHAQTPAPAQALKKAILKNDAAAAEALLAAGTNPNAVIEVVPGFTTTYLITAATNNSLPLVQLLLRNKAQVNQPDAFKGTALMAAVGKGNKALVELLLSSGADARAKDDDGKDALALAKEGGNKEIITLLELKLK